MLREIRDLGFEYAELSHGIRISLVPGILEAVDAGEIKISSLHNFCPLPIGVLQASPNLYEFSAENARDRELAFKYTLKTLDFAARVKAGIVVLHLGSIEMKDYSGKLGDLLKRGEKEKDTIKFARLRADAIKTRETKKTAFFNRVRESLRAILPEAEKRGIKLGCENRQAMEELPLDGDFENFLKEFPSPNIIYWHDTGHAQIKENFGIILHKHFLETQASRLGGFHVHDVVYPDRDHAAPGAGMIDFAGLKPFVKPHHIKVLELSPAMPAESAKKGVAHIKSIWGES